MKSVPTLTLSLLLLTAIPAQAQDPGWAVDPGTFTESMTITGQLHLDGATSTDRDDRVAAFVGGQLRGVAQPFPNGFIFLNVYANQQGETITFRAYDADADADGEVRDLVGRQRFITNCTQGSASHPFVWRDAIPDGATWAAPSPGAFNETLNLTATLEGGENAAKVAAFIGGEVRGLAEGDLSGTFTMTIYDESNNCSLVEFYAYGFNQEALVDETLAFRAGIVGSASNPFSLTLSGPPLPVELASFEALLDDQAVVLRWKTLTETNNAAFEVEHAAGDAAFARIAQVPGRGTTLAPQRYEQQVTGLAPGRHRFRLRQVDFDGTFSYSPVVEVQTELAAGYAVTAAYPNPFNPQAQFSVQVRQTQAVTVAVYDVLGREVARLHEGPLATGVVHAFTIDGASLPSGRYVYRVVGETFQQSRSVLLLK